MDNPPARSTWVYWTVYCLLILGACGPSVVRIEGVLPQKPRALELWNRSKGYVVFRVTGGNGDPLVTAALPPGGEHNGRVDELFGTLCPESFIIEIFAYRRTNPDVSALEDERLDPLPVASTRLVLLPERHYGCRADTEVISLVDTIFCDVLNVDEAARRIAFQAGSESGFFELLAQTDADRALAAAPNPEPAPSFPLFGRVIDQEGVGLAEAVVHLGDYDLDLATDPEGRFQFDRPTGSYELAVTAEGYEIVPPGIRAIHRSPRSGPVEFVARQR